MSEQRTHAETMQLARKLAADAEQKAWKLCVLSSCTADFLNPYIVVESNALGYPLAPWFGPFNQFEQLLLDEASTLWGERPDLLWITLRIEDVDRYLCDEFPSLDTAEAIKRISRIRERLVTLALMARKYFQGPIVVSNLTILHSTSGVGLFDASDPNGLEHLINAENRQFAVDISTISDTHIFDYAGCMARTEVEVWRDPRLWYMGRIAVGVQAQPVLANALVRTVVALSRPAAKCLVIDLDNTVWGGVIGDDGIGGIKLGDDYPGVVFKDIQSCLLGYRRRGFLLAIASKNDEPVVLEALETHPEMILRVGDFAAIHANWGPKSESLDKIATKLNIGLDSLVFIDDNPVERAEVNVKLPIVTVVDIPKDILGIIPAIRATVELEHPGLSQEDRTRADMYKREKIRTKSLSADATMEEFLVGLKMVAEVGILGESTQSRIHQLVNKTNQFNITTRRYTLEVIRSLAGQSTSEVAWLRLRDNFGDLGLVCVGILRQHEGDIWEIDTLLMSCRVMNRGVEDAFLSYLAELAREKNAKILRGVMTRTPKNTPAQEFYPQHGFAEVARLDNDSVVYEAPLDKNSFPWPVTIKRYLE